jgi:putative nucleotidyltransferase with HDIG domain
VSRIVLGPRGWCVDALEVLADRVGEREGAGIHSTLQDHPHLLDALDEALGLYHHGTALHADRVRQLASTLGAELGISGVENEALPWAALLHDLGKLGIPAAALSKHGPLSDAEWVEMRRHPTIGAEMLVSLSPQLEPIAAGVRAHHERWDGSGYPEGLVGEAIPRVGRIVAVADVFDAMTHPRPYRQAVATPDQAMAELRAGAGTDFDPEVIAAFTDLYRRGRLPEST